MKYLDSFKCYNVLTDLGGHPLGGGCGGWMDLYVGNCGCMECPMQAPHVHGYMHICTCMLNMINMDASMEAAICD